MKLLDFSPQISGDGFLLVNYLWELNCARPALIHAGLPFTGLKVHQWVRRPVTIVDLMVRWLGSRVRKFFGRS